MNYNFLHVFKGGMLANFFFKWQHVLIHWAYREKKKEAKAQVLLKGKKTGILELWPIIKSLQCSLLSAAIKSSSCDRLAARSDSDFT